MKTVTGQIGAWLSEYSIATPQDVAAGAPSLIGNLAFTRADSDMSAHGYTFVGIANVTLDLPTVDDLVRNKVSALTAQRDTIRAEANQKAKQIDDQIQSLLAISYDSGAA